MLNEKKVRLMTRMAMYESKEGKTDLEITSYQKSDYTSFETIMTVIWITIAYVIVMGIIALTFMEEIFQHMDFKGIIIMVLAVIGSYLLLAISYGVGAFRFYKKKYEESNKRVKIFRHDLVRLNRMYDREVE